MSKCLIVRKFCGNRSKHDPDIAIFRISRWQPSAVLLFLKFKILTVDRVMRMNIRHHAKICHNRLNRCRDMAIFQFFKMAAVRHHGFLNVHNFNGQHVGGTKYLYPYQTSLRSIEPLQRYGDFSIFQDGRRRHIGFLNF